MRNLAWSMLLGFVFPVGVFHSSPAGQRNAADLGIQVSANSILPFRLVLRASNAISWSRSGIGALPNRSSTI
jgi:hypothetical protein